MKLVSLYFSISLILACSAQAGENVKPSVAETCGRLAEALFTIDTQERELKKSEYRYLSNLTKRSYHEFCEMASAPKELKYANGRKITDGRNWFLPNGVKLPLRDQHTGLMDFERIRSNNSAPILNPFLAQHEQCAPGCGYVSWGIWGDEAHQARKSCHNSGEAIDFHAIQCGGTSGPESSEFRSYVSCMEGQFNVIFGSGDHANHAHIELQNCNMISGGESVPDSGGNDSGEEDSDGNDSGEEDSGEDE